MPDAQPRIATLGIERPVFAIDHPFIAPLHGEARTRLENARIAGSGAGIAHGTIERMLRLH
jgi:hypothetical protein